MTSEVFSIETISILEPGIQITELQSVIFSVKISYNGTFENGPYEITIIDAYDGTQVSVVWHESPGEFINVESINVAFPAGKSIVGPLTVELDAPKETRILCVTYMTNTNTAIDGELDKDCGELYNAFVATYGTSVFTPSKGGYTYDYYAVVKLLTAPVTIVNVGFSKILEMLLIDSVLTSISNTISILVGVVVHLLGSQTYTTSTRPKATGLSDSDFCTGVSTVDGFITPTLFGGVTRYFWNISPSGYQGYISGQISSTGMLSVSVNGVGTGGIQQLVLNTEYHIEITRKDSYFSVYVNGIRKAYVYCGSNIRTGTVQIFYNSVYNLQSTSYTFAGTQRAFRFTKNANLHWGSTSFTPPAYIP